MPYHKIWAFYIPILIWACSSESTDGPFDPERVNAEASAMLVEYHNEIGESGLEAEFRYLDSSDKFYWVPPGFDHALNYDEVRSILEKSSRQEGSYNFHWDELTVYPLSNSIGTFTGIVSGSITDSAGVQHEVKMIESGTLIRREDGWKLLCGQTRNL